MSAMRGRDGRYAGLWSDWFTWFLITDTCCWNKIQHAPIMVKYTLCSEKWRQNRNHNNYDKSWELNIFLAAWCKRSKFQQNPPQFLSNSCLKMELKNRSFQYGKVALAVSTQYHQLQFVLKVVTICTDICMSLVQTVHSLLLPDFLSADPVASICRRSRPSAEQDQSLSGNSS